VVGTEAPLGSSAGMDHVKSVRTAEVCSATVSTTRQLATASSRVSSTVTYPRCDALAYAAQGSEEVTWLKIVSSPSGNDEEIDVPTSSCPTTGEVSGASQSASSLPAPEAWMSPVSTRGLATSGRPSSSSTLRRASG
jgi:hypothetical protein